MKSCTKAMGKMGKKEPMPKPKGKMKEQADEGGKKMKVTRKNPK